MAIKKISEFVSAVPTSEDKILFEQNNKGKSCSIEDAVNTCSLSLEEIQNSADLTGKVASADALKNITPYGKNHDDGEPLSVVINSPCLVIISGSGNAHYYVGLITKINAEGINVLLTDNTYDSNTSYNRTTHTIKFPTSGWYEVIIIGGVIK